MAEILDMTPQQLREMADEAERKEGAAPGTSRTVEVDGVEVSVDRRVLDDVRTFRLLVAMNEGGTEAGPAALKLFDRLLGDQVGRVTDALSDADGFCSVQRLATFCSKVFEAVGAKN